MNRREFELIAEVIRNLPSFDTPQKPMGGVDVVRFDCLVNRFADALRTTNPRFNRERFITACNGKAGK